MGTLIFIISVIMLLAITYFIGKSKTYTSSGWVSRIDSKLNKFEKKIGGMFIVAFLSIVGGIISFIGFYFGEFNDLMPLAIFLIIHGVVWGIISYIFYSKKARTK